jgi:hypothetical protein
MSLALHNLEAHRAGAAFDDAGRRVDVVGVQVLHLRLGDLAQHGALDLAGRKLARLLGARLQVRGLLDEVGRRRRLGLEREAAIRIDGDDGGKGRALFLVAGLGVERLQNSMMVTPRWPSAGAGGDGLALRGHLQRDIAGDFLCHVSLSFVRWTPDQVR